MQRKKFPLLATDRGSQRAYIYSIRLAKLHNFLANKLPLVRGMAILNRNDNTHAAIEQEQLFEMTLPLF